MPVTTTKVTNLIGFISNDRDFIKIQKNSIESNFFVSFNHQIAYEAYSTYDIAIANLKTRYDSLESISIEETIVTKFKTPQKIK